MRRRSCTISPMRVAGTCSSSASLLTVRPSGFIKSSRRTSPGCTGGINPSDLLILSFLSASDSRQFPQGDPLNGTEPPAVVIVKELLSFLRAKALNHTHRILRHALYVKRQMTADRPAEGSCS